jgi:hypothetical protein
VRLGDRLRRWLPRGIRPPAADAPAGSFSLPALGGLRVDPTGRSVSDPAPEYIAEAATPPEEFWTRERARREAKARGEEPPPAA